MIIPVKREPSICRLTYGDQIRHGNPIIGREEFYGSTLPPHRSGVPMGHVPLNPHSCDKSYGRVDF